jgi:hypothetical protein
MAPVLNLSAARIARENPDLAPAISRLACRSCGHVVADEGEWAVGLDGPATAAAPLGYTDTGRYICPRCDEWVGYSQLDEFVRLEASVLIARIPLDLVVDAFLRLDLDNIEAVSCRGRRAKALARYNVGSAMLNAVRGELFSQRPDLAEVLFHSWQARIKVARSSKRRNAPRPTR